jgi:hypothetical protein
VDNNQSGPEIPDGGNECPVYAAALSYAAAIAVRETMQSEDNYGGANLHGSIPFAD